MERDFVIKTINELLSKCEDIELLYLVQNLLSEES